MASSPPDVCCSFCAKSQHEVRKIIAGPKVYICDECIQLCVDIIAEEWDEERRRTEADARLMGAAVCALCQASTSLRLLLEIPERGFLCFACVAAVRAATQSEAARGQ